MGVKRRLRVVKNWELRITIRLKGEEATGGWRKLQNEKLHYLNFPPDITRMVKSRRAAFIFSVEEYAKRGVDK
jgi:hypothetical protein